MEHLKQETVSGAQLNMDALYQICPQCFTESKDPKTGEVRRSVDFEKLRLLLGDNIAEGDERYDFTWVGKRAALQEAAKPIRKTLRPCPEESVDWENTKNLYIEGDNLEVLKLLQNSYMGKVKMIYIDPPYNTGNDFVYHDDFHQTKKDFDLFSGDVNEEGERLVKNTESNGRFHSDWCSMMYSRLMVARTLLTDDGVIFISIDDNEVDNLRKISDEVFGGANFMAHVIHKNNSMKNQSKYIGVSTEYVLVYTKDIDSLSKTQQNWRANKKGAADVNTMFKKLKDKGLSLEEIRENIIEMYSRPKYAHLSRWNKVDEKGVFKDADLSRSNGPKDYTITNPYTGKPCVIPSRGWGKSKDELDRLQKNDLIWYGDENTPPGMKSYLGDDSESVFDNFVFADTASDKKLIEKLFGRLVFEFPKSMEMMKLLISLCTGDGDIILDFFSGSATTAHALLELNVEEKKQRSFILIQVKESTDEKSEAYKAGFKNICEIGKERIRRAGKKIVEEQKQSDLFSGEQKKLDVGFRVFKCADSNMKDVYYAPSDYSQELLLGLEDNIKEDRNDLDLLFGCMLDWGVTLDLPLRTEKVDGVNIHIVNEGDLVACFEKHIPESVIDHIASLLPMRVVLRDSCFDEAKEKMNFFEIFKQRTGWSEEEVRKNVKVI